MSLKVLPKPIFINFKSKGSVHGSVFMSADWDQCLVLFLSVYVKTVL